MTTRSLAGFFLAFLVLTPIAAAAAEPVGKVSRIQGIATRLTEGQTAELALDAPVHLQDIIATGSEARLQLAFDDGTLLTLGEKARLTIDAFLYAPSQYSRFGVSVTGPFRFISGKMPKGPATQMSVTTPAATIGIRGTDFWGGPIAGAFGVFLIEGAISVANSAGQSTVTVPGAGVDISALGGPPGPVTLWAQPKIDAAIATVTFR